MCWSNSAFNTIIYKINALTSYVNLINILSAPIYNKLKINKLTTFLTIIYTKYEEI